MENTNTNVIFKRRGLAFYINIYFKIIAQDIKSKMSYRSDFIISTVGMVATNIAGFIAFLIMFGKFPSINGWGYYEILFLYGFSLISITPTQCLLDNNWSLRRYVYDGDFVKYCFRPINLWFYYVSEVFDVKGLGQLVFGFVTGEGLFGGLHGEGHGTCPAGGTAVRHNPFGAVNVFEDEKTYVVTVALPGVSKSEISVSGVDEGTAGEGEKTLMLWQVRMIKTT